MGEVAEQLQTLRRQWDSEMAARISPHVTLVYPEETVDELLLVGRVTEAAANTPSFAVPLADLKGGESGGVTFTASSDGER